MAGKDQMSVHRHGRTSLFNDTAGLVTNARNYKRRTGSHTDGCTKTGQEEAGRETTAVKHP